LRHPLPGTEHERFQVDLIIQLVSLLLAMYSSRIACLALAGFCIPAVALHAKMDSVEEAQEIDIVGGRRRRLPETSKAHGPVSGSATDATLDADTPCLDVEIDSLTGEVPPCGAALSWQGVNATDYVSTAAQAAGAVFEEDAYGDAIVDAVTQAAAAASEKATLNTLEKYGIPRDGEIDMVKIPLVYPGDYAPADYEVPDFPCETDQSQPSQLTAVRPCAAKVVKAIPVEESSCPCDCKTMIPVSPGDTVTANINLAAVWTESPCMCCLKLGLVADGNAKRITLRSAGGV